MNRARRLAAGLLAATLLCHCGAPQPPQCRRVPAASSVPAPTLLGEAHAAWHVLGNPARKRDWPAATASYNAAVTKLFDQLRCGRGSWQERAAALGTTLRPADRQTLDPAALDALFPATEVSTRLLKDRHLTPGLGINLVGWKATAPLGKPRPQFTLPTGLPYVTNATLDFSRPGPPAWRIAKRWVQNDITVGSARHPLAADWSAPNAFFWKMCDLDDLYLANLLKPDRFSEEIGLYFLQPYDPDKIPLVLVHGLVSSPDAFKHTINSLIPEPWLRERYQIWLFNYPTGNPWTYSAAKFREMLGQACAFARTKGHTRNLNRMVIIGHSMGGLITHASITDPGTAFYDARYPQPLNTLPVSAPARTLIQDTLLYRPLREPSRVVFLATPHQGSPMADLRIVGWFSHLIKLPKILTIDLLDSTVRGIVSMRGGTAVPDTSIGTLSPQDPIIRALATRPLPRTVTCHSVIGRIGRRPLEQSGDGIVPYKSAHITPVASEKIVPFWHSVQDCPETNAEIKRILLLHLHQN